MRTDRRRRRTKLRLVAGRQRRKKLREERRRQKRRKERRQKERPRRDELPNSARQKRRSGKPGASREKNESRPSVSCRSGIILTGNSAMTRIGSSPTKFHGWRTQHRTSHASNFDERDGA